MASYNHDTLLPPRLYHACYEILYDGIYPLFVTRLTTLSGSGIDLLFTC